MSETLKQRVLIERERLLREAGYCNEDQALVPTNRVEIMAQRNMWLKTSVIPYGVWNISTSIIAAQSLVSEEIISQGEFIEFMDDFGFEVDKNGRRPKPEMKERIKSLF